jgi:DNA-binding LacI/PurR family transcriptional regulator
MKKFKYIEISEAIREMIREGHFPTGKLPSEPKLMQLFNAGKITIYNALQLLVKEGVLRRVKSKGTFINAEGGKSLTMNSLVACVMPEHSHVWDQIASGLRISMLKNNLFSVPVDSGIKELKLHPESGLRSQLYLLLNSDIHSVVLDGAEYYELPFLENYPNKRSVVCRTFDAPGPIPDRAVLFDFESASYQCTKHLIQCGLKNILLFSYRPEPYPNDKEHLARTPHFQFEQGYFRAMREADLEKNIEVVYRGKRSETILRGLITRPKRPEGIVCCMDNDALTLIKLAMEYGISIPEELAVTGMYNTPWSEESPIKITTVEFSPEETANKITSLLLNEKVENPIEIVKPKLLVKDSG